MKSISIFLREMEKQVSFSKYSLKTLVDASCAIIFAFLACWAIPVKADSVRSSEIPKEREIHNTFSNNEKRGTILDATNPMQLINRLRQAKSMDNATSPSDAIDEALKLLEPEDSSKPPLQ